MVDKLSRQRRSENMSAIRSTGTKPELIVRKTAHRLGYRFRLYRKDLPGKPDLVFPSRRIVVFVHGCFWHQHPDAACKITRRPKSNQEYWDAKLDRNVDRDNEVRGKLCELGWSSAIIWECWTKDKLVLERRLRDLLA